MNIQFEVREALGHKRLYYTGDIPTNTDDGFLMSIAKWVYIKEWIKEHNEIRLAITHGK